MSAICEVNDDNFKGALTDAPLVLVDLWAAWCGPCRQLEPIIAAAAGKYAARVKFCKVDVDDSPLLVTKYDVQAVPTLLFLRAGEPVGRHVGLLSLSDLENKLDSFLEENA
ncbi:MAG: thioredoxin [Candidatus Latescibacterota bacterium]|jgi:thioredoxin